MTRSCGVCGSDLEGRHPSAKFCGATCRKRAQRRGKGSGSGSGSGSGLGDAALVASVERELQAAGRAETFNGQLAIQLARQVTAAGATGIASLSKELRTVMAAALEGTAPAGAAETEPEDEVRKAREARERKARAAAGRA